MIAFSASVQNLPTELLTQIFSHLPSRDVVHSIQLTSKLFYQVYANSLDLKKKIELDYTGLKWNPKFDYQTQAAGEHGSDGKARSRDDELGNKSEIPHTPSSYVSVRSLPLPLSSIETLSLLQSREDSWSSLSYKFKIHIPINHRVSGIYDLTPDVYFLGRAFDPFSDELGFAGIGLGPFESGGIKYLKLPTSGDQRRAAPGPNTDSAAAQSRFLWGEINVPGKTIRDFGTALEEHDLVAMVTSCPCEKPTSDHPPADFIDPNARNTLYYPHPTHADLITSSSVDITQPHSLRSRYISLQIHLNHLSTGQPHTSAAQPILPVHVYGIENGHPGVSIEIVGRYLAFIVLYPDTSDDTMDGMVIWDWMKGVRKSTWVKTANTGLGFLTETLVLHPNVYMHSFDIYEILPDGQIATQLPAQKSLNHDKEPNAERIPSSSHTSITTGVQVRDEREPGFQTNSTTGTQINSDAIPGTDSSSGWACFVEEAPVPGPMPLDEIGDLTALRGIPEAEEAQGGNMDDPMPPPLFYPDDTDSDSDADRGGQEEEGDGDNGEDEDEDAHDGDDDGNALINPMFDNQGEPQFWEREWRRQVHLEFSETEDLAQTQLFGEIKLVKRLELPVMNGQYGLANLSCRGEPNPVGAGNYNLVQKGDHGRSVDEKGKGKAKDEDNPGEDRGHHAGGDANHNHAHSFTSSSSSSRGQGSSGTNLLLPHASSTRPFTSSPDKSLMLFQMYCRPYVDREMQHFDILVRREDLIKLVVGEDTVVPSLSLLSTDNNDEKKRADVADGRRGHTGDNDRGKVTGRVMPGSWDLDPLSMDEEVTTRDPDASTAGSWPMEATDIPLGSDLPAPSASRPSPTSTQNLKSTLTNDDADAIINTKSKFHCSWEEWGGPWLTRWFNTEPFAKGYITTSCGERYVRILKDARWRRTFTSGINPINPSSELCMEKGVGMCLADFNPTRVRRELLKRVRTTREEKKWRGGMGNGTSTSGTFEEDKVEPYLGWVEEESCYKRLVLGDMSSTYYPPPPTSGPAFDDAYLATTGAGIRGQDERTMFNDGGVFASPIVSRLSYIEIVSKEKFTFDMVLMDEQRMLGFTMDAETGEMAEIDVLFFG